MIQNDKKTLSVTLGIWGTIHYMIVIYVKPVLNEDIFRSFFHFFKILIFPVVRGIKGQKAVQNDKKILSVALHISGTIRGVKGKKRSRMTKSCLLRSISQELYIIWLSFMVEMGKMIISPGVKILIFQVFQGLNGQIIGQNDKYFCLLHLIFQEPYIIWYDLHVWYTCIIHT